MPTSKPHLRAGLTALVAFAIGGVALAQAPGLRSPRDARAAEAREEADALSPRQMVSRSESYIDEMRKVLKEVLGILEDARDEKDVVKLNCVNEKLTQVKGLLRVSEQASIALQEAVAKEEVTEGRHEYTKIAIAREKVGQLRAEAEECIGQLAFVIDEDTVVEVDIPDDLPDDEPTIPEVPEVTFRFPVASPTGS